MRKFIYQSVVERLKEITSPNPSEGGELPPFGGTEGGERVIKHFDIWNNNLQYIEQNEAFDTPAVFVEFKPIEWKHQGGGIRDAKVDIVLHVITQRNAPTSHELPYEEQALHFFDLLTAINACLHGHFKKSDYFFHDALTATQSITDNDFEELVHSVEVFTCHAEDWSAKQQWKSVRVDAVIETGVM